MVMRTPACTNVISLVKWLSIAVNDSALVNVRKLPAGVFW